MIECPTREELRAYGLEQARQKGVPEAMYDKQIKQESDWQHCRPDGSLKVSSGNAVGVAQIIQKWHPSVDVTDPWASLRYSTDLMAGHRQKQESWRRALAAYNWGPANVAGYTDSAGRVHPAWDGTREWRCPHEGVVAQCKTGQMHRYLDVILGPGWPEPVENMPESMPATRYESMTAPHAGVLTACSGVILHGSRSGKRGNPLDQEALGTARYCVSNGTLSWHITCGPGVVYEHLDPKHWGWHALQSSKVYLGVEFAQPTVDDPITDQQVDAFVDWLKTRVLPTWPSLPMHFPSHAEADREFNVNQGKSDVFPLGDPRMDDLRARIMARLDVPAPAPEAAYSVGPGILASMQEHGDSPASDELFFKKDTRDEWSEAFGSSGVRYIYLPSVNRVFRYEPAA